MRKALLAVFLLLLAGSAAAQFVEEIRGIPQGTADALIEKQKQELVLFINPFLTAINTFIQQNPDPLALFGYWKLIILVISAFYILMFLVAGLKFVLGAYDVGQREEAKVWFKNALFVVIVLNASYLLYSILLDLGSGVSLVFWEAKFDNLFSFEAIESLNLFNLYYLAFSASLLWFTLFLRYALLLIGVVIFPVGLFLFFIPPLKTWGSAVLNLFGTAVFIQLVDTITLKVMDLTLASWTSPDFKFLIPSTAYFIIFFINLVMLLIAVLRGVHSVRGYSPNIANVVSYITPPSSYLSPAAQSMEREPSYMRE